MWPIQQRKFYKTIRPAQNFLSLFGVHWYFPLQFYPSCGKKVTAPHKAKAINLETVHKKSIFKRSNGVEMLLKEEICKQKQTGALTSLQYAAAVGCDRLVWLETNTTQDEFTVAVRSMDAINPAVLDPDFLVLAGPTQPLPCVGLNYLGAGG